MFSAVLIVRDLCYICLNNTVLGRTNHLINHLKPEQARLLVITVAAPSYRSKVRMTNRKPGGPGPGTKEMMFCFLMSVRECHDMKNIRRVHVLTSGSEASTTTTCR